MGYKNFIQGILNHSSLSHVVAIITSWSRPQTSAIALCMHMHVFAFLLVATYCMFQISAVKYFTSAEYRHNYVH